MITYNIKKLSNFITIKINDDYRLGPTTLAGISQGAMSRTQSTLVTNGLHSPRWLVVFT